VAKIIIITANKKRTIANIPPDHYTLESMANKLTKLFNKNDTDLSIETEQNNKLYYQIEKGKKVKPYITGGNGHLKP